MRNDEPLLPISNMADTNGKSNNVKRKKVLVVGAGAAGAFCDDQRWWRAKADAVR
jgi:NADPH-dependent glutamate synthase beta subunit-like oxidoreductase